MYEIKRRITLLLYQYIILYVGRIMWYVHYTLAMMTTKQRALGIDAMGSLLRIIHTHKNRKTKLDKNNCRIRLRVGLTLYNNDTNKRNDV